MSSAASANNLAAKSGDVVIVRTPALWRCEAFAADRDPIQRIARILAVKGLACRNDLHEILVSAGLGWGIGHSGAQGVNANAPDLLQPGIFFGKGFGDLPDGLAWLRPFGITGAVTLEHPMTGSSINFELILFAAQGQVSRSIAVRSVITSQQPIAAICRCVNLM